MIKNKAVNLAGRVIRGNWVLLAVLVSLLLAGTSAMLHSQLLGLGSEIFGDYALLRGKLAAPTCNANFDIEQRLDVLEQDFKSNNSSDESDSLDDLLGESDFDRAASRASMQGAKALCDRKHQLFEQNAARQSPALHAFAVLEQAVERFGLFVLEQQKLILIAVLFLCAIKATLGRHHIAFRAVSSRFGHHLAQSLEVFALGGCLLPATYSLAAQQSANLHWVVIGVIALLLASLYCWIRGGAGLPTVGYKLKDLLSVPIYVYMLLISAAYFAFVENHLTGVAIYFSQLFEQADMFLKIGLYVWLGMLIKQSKLGTQVFDLLRPLRLGPGLFAWLSVLLLALPTAYTGASGIIIIALGATVYQELRASGARPSLAMATTAMTGSAGVVLRPCLIIVLIAALNKEVVTDALYDWGRWVFLLTMVLFGAVLWLMGEWRWQRPSWQVVASPLSEALRALAKPLLLVVLIVLGYRLVLGAQLDEFSAPVILPVALLGVLWLERWLTKRSGGLRKSCRQQLIASSSETSLHLGALLMLMALSFTLGGVIERSDVVSLLPQVFASPLTCMAALVAMLVLIGMVMEPFGAVVLVSGTLATIAYNNGIEPVHFWMVTLVAFELGYLSPPVALNHLLTRQVIPPAEVQALEESHGDNFWQRHERFLLPLSVMTTVLILVAFVPLIVR